MEYNCAWMSIVNEGLYTKPYLDQNGFWICISLKGHLKQNRNAVLTVHSQIESLPYKGDATWGPSIVYHLQNLLY